MHSATLAGVVMWAIRQESGSREVVIEGQDGDGRAVVQLAAAYDASSAMAVAFRADPAIGSFDDVRAAAQRDLAGPAGGVQPKDYPTIIGLRTNLVEGCSTYLLMDKKCKKIGVEDLGTTLPADYDVSHTQFFGCPQVNPDESPFATRLDDDCRAYPPAPRLLNTLKPRLF
jgi:hypothetical protein